MRPKSLILTIAVILVFGSVILPAQEKRVYKIGAAPWIAWAPVYIAEAKGFWSELGISVKVVTFPTNMEITDATKSGLIDLGFDMLGTEAGLYMEGLPVVIIAECDWSHGGDKIIVKEGIDLQEAKGSTVGVFFNQPSLLYFLNLYLSDHGLSISDFRIAELATGTMADLFVADRLKIIVCYEPAATRAKEQGKGFVAATSAGYAGCLPEGLVTQRERLDTIPRGDMVKILKGYIRAAEWCLDESNTAEFVRIINGSSFVGSQKYSEEMLKEELKGVRLHDRKDLLERNRDGGGLQSYLLKMRDFLKANELLKKDFQPRDIFDNSFVMEAIGDLSK
jgi:NitT/TauT family transport system substrate-binding protein